MQSLTFAWHLRPTHRYNYQASLLLAEDIIGNATYANLFDHNDPGLLHGLANQIRIHLRHISKIWKQQQYERSLLSELARQEEEVNQIIFRRSNAANHRRRLVSRL